MRGRSLALTALVVGLSAPAAAFAEPSADDQQRAKESFGQAEAAFARKDFAAAAAAFEQAGRFAPHPTAFLNAAEAWELAGDLVRAAESCVQVKRVEGVEPPYVREAEARLAKLAERLGRIDVRGPAAMRVRVDGGEPLALPIARYVSPGAHRLRLIDAQNGTTSEREIAAVAGRVEAIELTVPSTPLVPPKPPAVPAAERALVPLGTWICFGIGGAAAVAMGITGGLTLSAQSTFEDQPSQDHADAFYRYRLGTNVLVGVVSAAFATGAIVWIVDATQDHATAWVRPAIGWQGGGMTLGGAF